MHQQILVIQPLPGIGDALWFLPHMKAIQDHYPKGEVSLLTKPSSRADQVLADSLDLKEVLWLKREAGEHSGLGGFFRLVTMLKSRKFEAVWILHKSPRYALAAKLAGIPIIYGYGTSYGALFTQKPPLTKQEQTAHPIERATHLLVRHGIETASLKKTKLKVSASSRKLIEKKFSLQKNEKVLVLGVGGSVDYKKWPATFFADVAVHFSKQNHRVFILGGAQERREAELIQTLVEESGAKATAVFDLSIPESFALLNKADLFIGNDTGMLNAAAMLGIQTYGFFAKTPPLTYRPNLHPITPTTDPATVSDITVDQVLGVVG